MVDVNKCYVIIIIIMLLILIVLLVCARLLPGLPRRDHVGPALKALHWLPVVYRIKFKVALMMFTVHTRRCPDYLTDSVQACNSAE